MLYVLVGANYYQKEFCQARFFLVSANANP
jgi:hypothetical protein